MFSHEALLIICIAGAPTHPGNRADVCGAAYCTKATQWGNFQPKMHCPPSSIETAQSHGSFQPTVLRKAPYGGCREVGDEVTFAMCQCSCLNMAARMRHCRQRQGRAGTAMGARGDHSQEKIFSISHVWGWLSQGCCLQGATCWVKIAPRAEPAGQDSVPM